MPKKRPAQRRPNMSRAVRLLLRDVARRMPELAHVDADAVLVVAGEARRASRATVRPMCFQETGTDVSADGRRRRPRMYFRGKRILYVVTLRPLFFRDSSAEKRVETILHELFHVSKKFNGTLDPARRHSLLEAAPFEREFRPLVKRYLARCPQIVIDRLSAHGEVLVRQWLEKPPLAIPARTRRGQRRHYSEEQTFLGPVRMITRHTRH